MAHSGFMLDDLQVFTSIPAHDHEVVVLRGAVVVYDTSALHFGEIQENAFFVIERQRPARLAQRKGGQILKYTLGFKADKHTIDRADALCKKHSVSRSDLLRVAWWSGLDGLEAGRAINHARLAQLTKYMQTALLVLLQELASKREPDMAATMKMRYEKYHMKL